MHILRTRRLLGISWEIYDALEADIARRCHGLREPVGSCCRIERRNLAYCVAVRRGDLDQSCYDSPLLLVNFNGLIKFSAKAFNGYTYLLPAFEFLTLW